MADKFAIKVTCKNCGFKDTLASSEDKSKPLLFDNAKAALIHAERFGKKSARVFRSLDQAMGIEQGGEDLYECPQCNAISRMNNLTLTVFRYQAE